MTEWEALMRAVCENPDDDTPRLVLADWLDENGEPERAEFIRLQCRTARLPYSSAESTPLRKRADQLLGRYSRRWAAELPHRGGYRWADVYRRGFQCAVMVEATAVLADLDEVFEAAPVTTLTVDHLLGLGFLIDRGYADRLRSVSVGSHNLDLLAAELCRLAAFPRLRLSVGVSFTNLGRHRISSDTEAALTAAFGERLRLPPAGIEG